MAERRMFAKTIIDSDAFLELPSMSQLLYFHLSMRADDDGFVNKPRSIMRLIGAKDDDMKSLIERKFVLAFESGIVVIKHWRIHNYIRNDRYSETKYKFERAQLHLDENKSYSEREQAGIPPGIPAVYQLDTQYGDTQVRLGKESIDKDSLGNSNDRDSLDKDKNIDVSISQIEIGVQGEEEVSRNTPIVEKSEIPLPNINYKELIKLKLKQSMTAKSIEESKSYRDEANAIFQRAKAAGELIDPTLLRLQVKREMEGFS